MSYGEFDTVFMFGISNFSDSNVNHFIPAIKFQHTGTYNSYFINEVD